MRKENIQYVNETVLEGMTSIRALLHAKEANLPSRSIFKILFDESKKQKLMKDLGYIQALSHKYQYEVLPSTNDEIDSYCTGSTHGGLIALCGEKPFPSLNDSKDQILRNSFYAYIDGIEDPYNFGYSIRSLYACGCKGIIVSQRNWFSAAGVIARASAGCSELIPTYITDSLEEALTIFKELSYTSVAADLRTEHVLGTTSLPYPIFLVVGGEKRGIKSSLLELIDLKVKIPYNSDFHADLPTSSATTMFAYEIMRQNFK